MIESKYYLLDSRYSLDCLIFVFSAHRFTSLIVLVESDKSGYRNGRKNCAKEHYKFEFDINRINHLIRRKMHTSLCFGFGDFGDKC